MKKSDSGLNPQNTRKTPATEPEAVMIEWEYAVALPEEELLAVAVVPAPEQMERPKPAPYLQKIIELREQERKQAEVEKAVVLEAVPVPDWSATLWRLVWVLVKMGAPLAMIAALLYGAFLAISWLVAQTLFWVFLFGLAAVFVLLSFFLEAWNDNPRPKVKDKNPASPGNVVTNVHVEGGANVLTNVFVTFKTEEHE